jgi:hypothetical protein
MCNASPDIDMVFAAHFRRFIAAAGRHSLFAGSEVETDPREIRRFAEYRFASLLQTFEASLRDSWDAVGPPLRRAAVNSARRRDER